jgi:hypothetical protein
MMNWWNSLPRSTKLWCGAFTALVAAFFSLGQALTASEPWHPATHGFVRDAITRSYDVLAMGQVESQIETVEVRRSLVDKEDFELEMTLRNSTALPDQVRQTLELRKRALADDRRNLDYRLDQLQRARSGRRP